MCAQGAVWYFTFFYMQVFLERSLGLPGATKDLLLIVMTVVSAPLYVYFGWLSDRVGRKPVMVGGMLLALVLYFPGSHWIAERRQPGAGGGAARDAGLRRDRPRNLLGPVRPGRHREVRQRLRYRQERRLSRAAFPSDAAARRTARPRVIVGTERVPIERRRRPERRRI